MCQQVEFSVLFPDSVCPDELELLQCKLIELVFHLPDGRLLQLGNGLLSGGLLLAGLPQVGFLPCDNRRRGLKVLNMNASTHMKNKSTITGVETDLQFNFS